MRPAPYTVRVTPTAPAPSIVERLSAPHRGPVPFSVEFFPPRDAEAESRLWRAVRIFERLSPAFHRDDMDWESAHSPVIWVDTWRSALADARAGGVSYLLVRIDDGVERVVGYFSMTGRDARTRPSSFGAHPAEQAPCHLARAARGEGEDRGT